MYEIPPLHATALTILSSGARGGTGMLWSSISSVDFSKRSLFGSSEASSESQENISDVLLLLTLKSETASDKNFI